MTDDDLEDIFAAARGTGAEVGDDLMARVLADAARVQPAPVAAPSIWSQIREALGGWPVLGGVAAAGLAGVWIGYAPPSAVSDWSPLLADSVVSVDILGTSDAWLLDEVDNDI